MQIFRTASPAMNAWIHEEVLDSLVSLVGTSVISGLLLGRIDPTGRLFHVQAVSLASPNLSLRDEALYPVGVWMTSNEGDGCTLVGSDFDFLTAMGNVEFQHQPFVYLRVFPGRTRDKDQVVMWAVAPSGSFEALVLEGR